MWSPDALCFSQLYLTWPVYMTFRDLVPSPTSAPPMGDHSEWAVQRIELVPHWLFQLLDTLLPSGEAVLQRLGSFERQSTRNVVLRHDKRRVTGAYRIIAPNERRTHDEWPKARVCPFHSEPKPFYQ